MLMLRAATLPEESLVPVASTQTPLLRSEVLPGALMSTFTVVGTVTVWVRRCPAPSPRSGPRRSPPRTAAKSAGIPEGWPGG